MREVREMMQLAEQARAIWLALRHTDKDAAGEMLRASIIIGSAALTRAHAVRSIN